MTVVSMSVINIINHYAKGQIPQLNMLYIK